MSVTKDQITAGFRTVQAVAEAIRDLKRVPSGVLYTNVAPLMDLATYEEVISVLKNTGLVTDTQAHELVWVEPTGGAK